MYLGIDLGTTNSVVSRSFVDSNDNLVTEVVRLGQMYNDNWEKYESLPSMVYFFAVTEISLLSVSIKANSSIFCERFGIIE